MAVICRDCWRSKLGVDRPTPPVRTAPRDACDFCGADPPNYTYPDDMIPGAATFVDTVADKEERT